MKNILLTGITLVAIGILYIPVLVYVYLRNKLFTERKCTTTGCKGIMKQEDRQWSCAECYTIENFGI